ncbi:MAG: ABC transporter ATP-binding protein [Candidatus Brockarchaeota archaeon]|nr:ABC transporter ATP-binding protein [Candidatus Brockarchaeota archaeon]
MEGFAVQADGLKKAYGSGGKRTQALLGVDLRVRKGEIVCLLGPNGAGKTTLVKILSTLLLPDEGAARVVGYDVVSQAGCVRRVVGYAGQDSERSAYFRRTTRENLLFFANAFHGIGRTEAERRIEGLAAAFDFKDSLDKYFIALSGGQKQMFVIMRALITEPDVVFMDEPSKSLDPLAASKVRAYLKEYAKSRSVALVVTTHNMKEAEEMSDRVVMINKGRVLFDGTTVDMRESVTKTEVVEIAGNHVGDAVRRLVQNAPGVIGVHEENSNFRLYCKDAYEVLPRVVEILRLNGQRPAVGIEHLTLEEAFKAMLGGEGA